MVVFHKTFCKSHCKVPKMKLWKMRNHSPNNVITHVLLSFLNIFAYYAEGKKRISKVSGEYL